MTVKLTFLGGKAPTPIIVGWRQLWNYAVSPAQGLLPRDGDFRPEWVESIAAGANVFEHDFKIGYDRTVLSFAGEVDRHVFLEINDVRMEVYGDDLRR